MKESIFESKAAVITSSGILCLIWLVLIITNIIAGEYTIAILDFLFLLMIILMCSYKLLIISQHELLEDQDGMIDLLTQMLDEYRREDNNGKDN